MLATCVNIARFFFWATFFPSWKLCLKLQETWNSLLGELEQNAAGFYVNCSAPWKSLDAGEAAMLRCSLELSGFQLRLLLLGYSCPQPAMFAELQQQGSRARREQRAGSSTHCSAFPAGAGPAPSGLAGDLPTPGHSSQRFRATNPVELTQRKNRNARVWAGTSTALKITIKT